MEKTKPPPCSSLPNETFAYNMLGGSTNLYSKEPE